MSDIGDLFECEEDVKMPRLFWFLCISPFWIWWIIQKANDAHAKKAAEVADEWFVSRWMDSGAATRTWVFTMLAGLAGLGLVFVVAHFIGLLHASVARSISQTRQNIQNKRDQRAFESKMQDMDRQNSEQAALSQFARSKKELIMRLGSIDQYIRVLEIEKDTSKRTVALQAAHSEMTTITAKLASGEIIREALDAPEVRAQALETSKDLVRLGFAEDRLNRGIVQRFRLEAGGAG